MKHHLLLFDPENRLWSRPDILPGHVFGMPEHALAFGHTETRSGNPDSGIWFHVLLEARPAASILWADGCSILFDTDPDKIFARVIHNLLYETRP